MLSAAFFFSVFISIVWAFYALSNISGGEINHFVVAVAVVFLPIIIIWLVFGYIYQYISASIFNKNMYSLFKQMKKNQETAEVIARALLESREEAKNNTIISKFDIFVSDMNELLSDIVRRAGLVSDEQIDALWIKVKNGGKWAFGKVIIELAQKQPNLSHRLLQKALAEPILGGTILEFCSRYQSLVNALEKHDSERIFLNVIETGVLGKVFSLFAQPADSIRQNRDLTLVRKQINEVNYVETSPEHDFSAPLNIREPEEKPTEQINESARRLFVNTFRKKETKPENQETKDPLTMAFAKSFGNMQEEETPDRIEPSLISETMVQDEEPESVTEIVENTPVEEKEVVIEDKIETISMPEIVISKEEPAVAPKFEEEPEPYFEKEDDLQSQVTPELTVGFHEAQEQLEDIKKEWEAAKQRDLQSGQEQEKTLEEGMPEPKINNNEDFSYPFGGWMNTDNYEK